MKIDIPRVVRPIVLSDYAPEFGDQAIQMWVNPPRQVRLDYYDMTQRYRATMDDIEAAEEGSPELAGLTESIVALAAELHAWYAMMWSQGGDEWTAENVQEFAAAALDTDPGLWSFVQEQSLDVMAAYRRQKKADTPGQPQ